LRFHRAEGIADVKVKNHEQLKRAAEIGVGYMNADMLSLRSSNLADDEEFDDLMTFVKHQI